MDQVQLDQQSAVSYKYPQGFQQPYHSNDVRYLDSKALVKYSKEKYMKGVSQDLKQDRFIQGSSLVITDISLGYKGPREDEQFANNPDMHYNIRRGLSVLEIFDSNTKERVNAITVRKGLHKFFDISLEYLDLTQQAGLIPDIEKTHHSTNKAEKKMNNIILSPIKQSFKDNQNTQICIYKSEKANGENAQVSYCQQIDAFICCSKNVSLVARTKSDLESYKQQEQQSDRSRYSFAILIAEIWFDTIAPLSPEKLQELKAYLNGKTFVAEYCGNQNFQHLVKYTEIQLRFYAIVMNDSAIECLPLEVATDVFKHFGLVFCNFEKRVAKNWDEFNYEVYKLYSETSSNSVEQDGEGAVLYFFSYDTQTGQYTPLSLCKLKTLEYRLFRKLREKLKNNIAKNRDHDKALNAYKKESSDLCVNFKPAKDLEYYFQVAKTAFDFIANAQGDEVNVLYNRYITFLDMIIKTVDDKKQMDRQQIMQMISEIPMTEEERAQLETSKIPKAKIIFYVPALYFQKNDWNQVEQELNTKVSYNRWNPQDSCSEQIEVVVNYMGIKDLRKRGNIGKLNKNHFIVFAGFNKSVYDRIGNQIENFQDTPTLKQRQSSKKGQKKKTTVQYDDDTEQIMPYTKSNDKPGFFDQQIEIAQEMYEVLSNDIRMKNNVLWIDDVYQQVQQKDIGQFLYTQSKQGVQQVVSGNQDVLQEDEEEEEFKTQIEEQKMQVEEKKLYVFIPSTIPASGKTTFVTAIQQELPNYKFYTVSSDKMRKKAMDDYMKKNKSSNKDKAFEKSGSSAKKAFENEVKQCIRNIANKNVENNILFVDKNHPPNGINSTVQLVQNSLHGNIDVRFISVVPKSKEMLIDRRRYPFSYSYLFTCLHRAMNRDEHETLTGDQFKIGGVILMFFDFFKNTNLQRLGNYGIDHILELPFHNESQNIRPSKQFQDSLIRYLNSPMKERNNYVNLVIQQYFSEQIEIKENDMQAQIKECQTIIHEFLQEQNSDGEPVDLQDGMEIEVQQQSNQQQQPDKDGWVEKK